jgi:hypothetical protein
MTPSQVKSKSKSDFHHEIALSALPVLTSGQPSKSITVIPDLIRDLQPSDGSSAGNRHRAIIASEIPALRLRFGRDDSQGCLCLEPAIAAVQRGPPTSHRGTARSRAKSKSQSQSAFCRTQACLPCLY